MYGSVEIGRRRMGESKISHGRGVTGRTDWCEVSLSLSLVHVRHARVTKGSAKATTTTGQGEVEAMAWQVRRNGGRHSRKP